MTLEELKVRGQEKGLRVYVSRGYVCVQDLGWAVYSGPRSHKYIFRVSKEENFCLEQVARFIDLMTCDNDSPDNYTISVIDTAKDRHLLIDTGKDWCQHNAFFMASVIHNKYEGINTVTVGKCTHTITVLGDNINLNGLVHSVLCLLS